MKLTDMAVNNAKGKDKAYKLADGFFGGKIKQLYHGLCLGNFMTEVSKMKKSELVRAIQKTEGNEQCFETGTSVS